MLKEISEDSEFLDKIRNAKLEDLISLTVNQNFDVELALAVFTIKVRHLEDQIKELQEKGELC